MKKIGTAAVLMGLASGMPAVAAQDLPFVGWNAGVGAAFSSQSVALASGAGQSAGDYGDNTVRPRMFAEYGVALSPQAVLGVGVAYDLGHRGYGATKLQGADNLGVRARDQFEVYLAPGYRVGEQTLAYLKVGFNQARFSSAWAASADGGSQNHQGVGYGAGVRTMLNRQWFAQLEAEQVRYNSRNNALGQSLKPTATLGALSIGRYFD